MSRLILRVRRAGRLLGSWSIGDEPIEFAVVDVMTGRELASFAAQGTEGDVDEVPIDRPQRIDGDDLTMPLPEPTDTQESHQTDKIPIPVSVAPRKKRKVPNLATPKKDAPLRGAGGVTSEPRQVAEGRRAPPKGPVPRPDAAVRQEGDDFTMPVAETTVTSEVPVDFDTGDVSGPEQSFDEVVELRPTAAEDEVSRSIGAHLVPDELTSGEITLGEPVSATHEIPSELERPTDVGVPPGSDQPGLGPLAEMDTRRTPAMRVPPAEVWVRRNNEWHPAGHLVPGQRVLNLGGWVRLANDGRVIVCSGPKLNGSATLLDGRTVGITRSEDAISLPPGASVVLRYSDNGLYIRSEPLGELGRPGLAYEAPPARYPGSHWRR